MDVARRDGLDRWDLLIVAVVAVGVTVLHVGSTGRSDDPGIYLEMARRPLEWIGPAPFRFRVATPLAAAVLPGPVPMGFLLVSGLGLAGSALIVRRTAARITTEARGLVAAGLLVTSSASVQIMRVPYATEPLSMLAAAAGLELGRQRRWLAAGIMLAAGTTVRETTLFVLLPLGAWCLASTPALRDRARAATALAAPGIAVYLLLHRTALLYGQRVGEHVQSPAEILAWNMASPFGFGWYLVLVVLGSLGLMWWYLPLVSARAGDRSYLSCSLLLLVPLVLGCVIASDWGRILGYAAIVAAPAVACVAPRAVLGRLVALQALLATAVALYEPQLALLVAAVSIAVLVRTRPTETEEESAALSTGIKSTLGALGGSR